MPEAAATSDITASINNLSIKTRCDDTGKVWIRKSPTCDGEIRYKHEHDQLRAIRKNCRCKKCYTKETNAGRIPDTKARLNMSLGQRGRKHSEETKKKMSGKNNGMFGVHRCGIENPFHGKKHNEETRMKMRIAMCRKIVQKSRVTGKIANVNPRETEYFSSLERLTGWDGVFYGKNTEQTLLEIGYFVDYYEPTKNIVVEYDEPKHYRCGKLRERDVIRMNNIKTALKSRFFRFNEKLGTLTEY